MNSRRFFGGKLFLGFLLPSLLLSPAQAQVTGAIAPPPQVTIQKSRVMVSFGDSITAGAFADTAADLPTSFFPSFLAIFNLTEVFKQKALETVVENKELWSWASGAGISSHFTRLKKYLKTNTGSNELQMINMAVSGSVASDVVLQVNQFASAMAQNPDTEIEYVTILIGANDVCDRVSSDDTSANLEKAFDRLSAIPQKKPLKILVSSIPQIYQLGQSSIKNHVTGNFFLSCEFVRSKVLQFCNDLTHWSDQAGYDANVMKVQQTNLILENSVNAARFKHANLDVQFSHAMSEEALPFNILASDCFHPNISGQQKIADMLWNDQPWFK